MAYFGGFLLLRCQCGRQRVVTKRRLKRSIPACATWLFIGLLLSQHVQPVATMMLRNQVRHGRPQSVLRPHNPLPPPGNTSAEVSSTCLQLTDVGQQQQQWIANYLTMKNQAKEIWRILSSAGGRELRDELAFNVQKPFAVPTRMSHPPLLPIAETDGKTAISLERALGLTDNPVGSRRTDVVTPGFQNSSVTKGRSVGLDSNLCDLDDLMTPWRTSTIPSVDHILTYILIYLHDFYMVIARGVYDIIEVYTDGSFASHSKDEDNSATWAIAICGRRNSDDPIHLLDWYGDYVIDDALDQQWVGATRQHIREAEATALIWTAFYLMAHHPAAKLVGLQRCLAVRPQFCERTLDDSSRRTYWCPVEGSFSSPGTSS